MWGGGTSRCVQRSSISFDSLLINKVYCNPDGLSVSIILLLVSSVSLPSHGI